MHKNTLSCFPKISKISLEERLTRLFRYVLDTVWENQRCNIDQPSAREYEPLYPRFEISFTWRRRDHLVAQLVGDLRDAARGHKLVTLLRKGNARDSTCRKPRLGCTIRPSKDCVDPEFILKPHSSRSQDESIRDSTIRPRGSFVPNKSSFRFEFIAWFCF